ncbi:hypothetical protein FOL47_005156 [Perkinsus chesapeaki]|uniref:dual-specificity kinase n=1 Tax=Perkinsus chesapeaki TaxID=330153 RepID=A0A7J6LYR4_PERCH|nr:hypothetical protein FOL47_005156 [Perkinsus chesapeaki]
MSFWTIPFICRCDTGQAGRTSATQLGNGLTGRLIRAGHQPEGDGALVESGRTSTASEPKPGSACTEYGAELSGFEQREILNYRYIWFIGHPASRQRRRESITDLCNSYSMAKDVLVPQCALPNYGYDSDDGSYRFISHDHFAYRFEVLNLIGRGTFGQVAEVFDHRIRRRLAMKTVMSQNRARHREMLELKALKRLAHINRKNDNTCIIEYLGSFKFRNHTCFLFEPGYKNLYEHLRTHQFKPVPLPTIQAYAYQLVRALVHLRKAEIIHCDLKPENILLMSPKDDTIRVIDFGSSQFGSSLRPPCTYIQSRYYRSPEIILCLPYSYAIDMWSFGCIIAELRSGSPLFAGINEADQIDLMTRTLGEIPSEIREQSPRKGILYSDKRNFESDTCRARRVGGGDVLSGVLSIEQGDLIGIKLLDLVRQALMWNPARRLSAEDASVHPFLCEAAVLPL